jgi:hypothetical protein
MSREVNPVTARGPRHNLQRRGETLRATCLLCRVLWPRIVQHRHLLFDYSSEASTLFLTQRQPRGHRNASGCSHHSSALSLPILQLPAGDEDCSCVPKLHFGSPGVKS